MNILWLLLNHSKIATESSVDFVCNEIRLRKNWLQIETTSSHWMW